MSEDDSKGQGGAIPDGRREFFGKLLAAGAAGGAVLATSSTANAACAQPVKVETKLLVTENTFVSPEQYEQLVIERLLAENVLAKDDNGEWRSKVTVLVNSGCMR
jgi:hypothetical protein